MPEYQFVVSSGQARPATKDVRSHAMKVALEKRAKDPDGELDEVQSADSQLTQSSKDSLKGRFRLANRPKKKKPHGRPEPIELVVDQDFTAASAHEAQLFSRFGNTSAPGASVLRTRRVSLSHYSEIGSLAAGRVGRGYLDPFGALPVEHNRRVDMLVKYFLTKFLLNMSTSDTQKHWFAFSMREPLIMHTTLALSGNGWVASSPEPDSKIRQEVLRQKGQAIKMVNSLLAASDITNTLIAGVANLANVACFEGSFLEADTHMRGLKRLVDLRGGYETFIHSPLVIRSVTWADLQTSAALGRRSFFPLVYAEEHATLPPDLVAAADSPSLAHVETLSPVGRSIKQCLILLRRAILVCGTSASSEVIRLHMHKADDAVNHLLFDGNDTDLLSGPLRPLLLAAHLFLYVAMRQVPKRGAVVLAMVDRLENSLRPGHMDSATWGHHLPMLLWILFVGASAVTVLPEAAREDEHWLRSQFGILCRVVQPLDKKGLEGMLKAFVWRDKVCGAMLDDLWESQRLGYSDR